MPLSSTLTQLVTHRVLLGIYCGYVSWQCVVSQRQASRQKWSRCEDAIAQRFFVVHRRAAQHSFGTAAVLAAELEVDVPALHCSASCSCCRCSTHAQDGLSIRLKKHICPGTSGTFRPLWTYSVPRPHKPQRHLCSKPSTVQLPHRHHLCCAFHSNRQCKHPPSASCLMLSHLLLPPAVTLCTS